MKNLLNTSVLEVASVVLPSNFQSGTDKEEIWREDTIGDSLDDEVDLSPVQDPDAQENLE